MQNLSLIKMQRSPSLLAAWLGLLAVIMLFIAPVISKSLAVSPAWHSMMMPGMAMAEMAPDVGTPPHTATAQHQRASDQTATAGGMSVAEHEAGAHLADHEAMMAADRGSPSDYADGTGRSPLSLMDDSACGYCVLLAHLPLDLTRLPPLWSSLQAARPPVVVLFTPVVARFVPRFFHPRAPPRH